MNRWAFVALIGSALSLLADSSPERSRFYVTRAASSLVDQGLASPAPSGSEAAAFQQVPAPAVRFLPNQAQATISPWVDTNVWRFRRGVKKANYAKLPAGSAPLAAAESFAFRVDAILNPDPADVQELGQMLAFLKAQDQLAFPVMANIGVVDDGSQMMGEVLNMLTRRNLLFRVEAAPDPKLDLNLQPGSPDFPKELAANASDFAARVREKLGDDKRLVRVYGSTTTITQLTGDGKRARLILLSYSRNRRQEDVRIRMLGRYKPAKFAAYRTTPDAQLMDIENLDNATEFSIPAFSSIAIVDLDVMN